MPAEVLGVRVVADVVGLALGAGGAEGQTVAVPPHLLHLQHKNPVQDPAGTVSTAATARFNRPDQDDSAGRKETPLRS